MATKSENPVQEYLNHLPRYSRSKNNSRETSQIFFNQRYLNADEQIDLCYLFSQFFNEYSFKRTWLTHFLPDGTELYKISIFPPEMFDGLIEFIDSRPDEFVLFKTSHELLNTENNFNVQPYVILYLIKKNKFIVLDFDQDIRI